MLVIVAGMPRSGSTFSFNVVRATLDHKGKSVRVFVTEGVPEEYDAQSADNWIVKTHRPDEAVTELIRRGKASCICTYRRPVDAIASWRAAFGHPVGEIIEMFRQWFLWRQNAEGRIYDVKFDSIVTSPLWTIIRIQAAVGRLRPELWPTIRKKLDLERVREFANALPPSENTTNIGFSYYDKETLFHRNHVTGAGAAQSLNESELSEIRTKLAEFLSGSGDLIIPRRSKKQFA